MIYENDAKCIKTIKFVRIFALIFAICLMLYLYNPVFQYGGPESWIDLFPFCVPILILVTLLAEFFISSFIKSIEIDNSYINIKYGNGYFFKNLSISKNEIRSFSVLSVYEWFLYANYKRLTEVIYVTIMLDNNKKIIIKDNCTYKNLLKLFDKIKEQIPNYKCESDMSHPYARWLNSKH